MYAITNVIIKNNPRSFLKYLNLMNKSSSNKVVSYVLKNKMPLAVIFILFVWAMSVSYKNDKLEFSLLYGYETVPHIELVGGMGFYGRDTYMGKVVTSSHPGDIAYGKISGFVKFDDETEQPKNLWQYYIIEPTILRDTEGTQLFTLEEVIKVSHVAPKSFGKEVLTVINNSIDFVTFKSEEGIAVRIDKRTNDVVVTDAEGDKTSLIVNSSDYRDFMLRFLKSR